jgi:5-methylcytosine-specific restriction endonuclease McrA
MDLKTGEGRQSFYQSKEWEQLRKLYLYGDEWHEQHLLCEECLKNNILKPAIDIHHKKDISDCPTMDNATDYYNLMALCRPCHSTITSKKPKPIWKPFNLKEFLSNQK